MKNGKYPDNGFVCWYKEGKLHREDGPAVEYSGGEVICEWYKEGKLHREDGPAIVRVANEGCYYLNGELLWSNWYYHSPVSKEIPEEVKRIMIKERLNPQLSQLSTSIMNEEL